MLVEIDIHNIDVDKAIEIYNKKYPHLKPLTRKDLAKLIGVNPQLFSDWKNGRTPNLIYTLLRIEKITGAKRNQYITK